MLNKKYMQNSTFRAKNKKTNESYNTKQDLVKTFLLGVGVTNEDPNKILEYIVTHCKKSAKPYYVVTPNPEMLVLADKNPEFKKILNNAKIASNDGVGLRLAAWFLGLSLKSRLTGVEMVEKLCEMTNDWPITVGFLGAGPKVAEKAFECLKSQYPNLKIGFVGQEWSGNVASSIDILFVAFGAPKQELWMAEMLGKIPVKVMIGVGGAFDQIADTSLRPHAVIHSIGLGWFYRLVRQPWRIKRQLALLKFIWLVLRERILSLRGMK